MTQTLERDTAVPVTAARTRPRRWIRPAGLAVVLALFATEITIGWSSLATALRQLHTPSVGWLALVVVAELAAMSAYAHMQRRLLRSAGVRSSYGDSVRLAYAAHSLNETLPGGPAFSTQLNYQQMRRFGASPAVASWAIALSGILSAIALAAITTGGALASGGATSWTDIAALLTAAVVITLGVRHLARHPATAGLLLRRPIAAVNRLRRRPAAAGQERVAGFVDQLRAARLRPADGIAAVVYALLNWLLDATALWLCFHAVGERSLTPTATLLAFCAAMAAGSVTIVPGGLGIVDSALLLGLVTGGAALPVAISVVVLYRIVSFGFIIGLGWFFWLQLRARPRRTVAGPARRSTSGPRTSTRLIAVCPRRAHLDAAPHEVQTERSTR